jgi:hypothetical protein
MAWQIIKQPNDLYAIWSTVVDDFIVVDCSRDEVVQEFIEYEAKQIRDTVAAKLDQIDKGEKAYHQFTQTFDECITRIREIHGDDCESLKALGFWNNSGSTAER